MKQFDLRYIVCLGVLPWMVGCASLKTENMVADETSFAANYSSSVALNVGGGSAGVKWYSGTIEPSELEEAVRTSIVKANLFDRVVAPGSSDYLLSADLAFAGSHPGFNMHAWVVVKWALTDCSTGKSAWNAEINTEGKATVGDAFVGARRQYIALERAAKANITDALTQIGALHLESP